MTGTDVSCSFGRVDGSLVVYWDFLYSSFMRVSLPYFHIVCTLENV